MVIYLLFDRKQALAANISWYSAITRGATTELQETTDSRRSVVARSSPESGTWLLKDSLTVSQSLVQQHTPFRVARGAWVIAGQERLVVGSWVPWEVREQSNRGKRWRQKQEGRRRQKGAGDGGGGGTRRWWISGRCRRGAQRAARKLAPLFAQASAFFPPSEPSFRPLPRRQSSQEEPPRTRAARRADSPFAHFVQDITRKIPANSQDCERNRRGRNGEESGMEINES